MSSCFGNLEVTNWQCPHFIHSTFVDLEGWSHPTATGTLVPSPAEVAQLRHAFGTQKLQEKPRTQSKRNFDVDLVKNRPKSQTGSAL